MSPTRSAASSSTTRPSASRRPTARRSSRSSTSSGIIPGIKVDPGAKPLALAAEGETVTEGLDGLRDRLAEYTELGAKFAKWRATYTITDELPSPYAVDVNAHALARYAALCQEAGIVPIVEPEVLMDGTHTIERASDVTGAVLQAVFDALFDQRCVCEGLLLKPNMVLPGYDGPHAGLRRGDRGRRPCGASAESCRRQCRASCSCRAARATSRRRRV